MHPRQGYSPTGITQRAQLPGELLELSPYLPVPSEGPHGQGHHTGRVSVRLSRSTNRRLSLAGPHRGSLRHEAAAAPGCWQPCRARAWAAVDTNRRLRPRH